MTLAAKVATINFGGINTSESEFVNYSDPELKEFSVHNLETFKQYFNLDQSIRKFIDGYLKNSKDSKHLTFKNFIISQAELFFIQCMTPELLSSLKVNKDDDSFNLNEVSMGNYLTYILSKDKGLGGFEQFTSSRKCNLGKNLGIFLSKSSQKEIDQELFIKSLFEYYNTQFTSDISKLVTSSKPYSEFFMKGRNEGNDGSDKNYYRLNIFRNDVFNTRFESVACLNLILYDLLSLDILLKCSKIPENFVTVTDEYKNNIDKMNMIADWFVNSKLDILFITECIPNIFDNKFTNDSIYVAYGTEYVGQCNAIIYRLKESFIPSPLESIDLEHYTNTKESKDPPLVLANSDRTQHLMHIMQMEKYNYK